jgi:hypothetical protein
MMITGNGASSTHQFDQSGHQRFESIARDDEGHTKRDRKYRPTAHRVTPHDSKGSIAQSATGNLLSPSRSSNPDP